MANKTGSGYDPGPQLPSYMRNQVKKAEIEPGIAETGTNKSGRKPAKRTTEAPKTGGSYKSTSKKRTDTAKRTERNTKRAETPARKIKTPRKAANKRPVKANTAASRQSSARKKTKRTNGNRYSGTLKILLLVVLSLIAVVIAVALVNGGQGSSEDIASILTSRRTFASGVTVEGVDVSGLTAEEATGLVKNAAEKRLKTVALTIIAGDGKWTLDAEALGMGYSVDQALADGIVYGMNSAEDVEDITGNGAGEYSADYTWDRNKILLALQSMAGEISSEATEPYADPILDFASEERFNFVSGEDGTELNVDDTADSVEYALRTGDFTGEVTAVVNAVHPTTTVEDVKAETAFIADFTTKFSAPRDNETKQNRKFNIEKAAGIINGQRVDPGEEWSFNTVVGPRTYDLGWKGANGISNGKEYTTQAGGGICQVSTTLYNALLRCNLEIVDRQAHSIPSDYVDKGLDATVDTSGIDFVWKNNTEYPVYIFAEVAAVEGSSSRNTITVSVYGAPLPEGVSYKARSEIIETTERTDTIYSYDSSIPTGYQKELIIRHDGFVAEAYLDKYEGDSLADSVLMHTDKYKGNPAEIAIGTGAAVSADKVSDDLQVYGTSPTKPS